MTGDEKNKAERFQLRFALSQEQAAEIRDPQTVVVWPSKNGWNDQGYRLLVEYVVHTGGHEYRPSNPAAMVVPDFKSIEEGIGTILNPRRLGGDLVPFASLQMDVNEYRRIARDLGVETATRALEAMNDVVVEEAKTKPANWLAAIKGTEAFSVGLLRTNARYFAYRRGIDFLRGNEQEAIDRAAANAVLTFKLDSFSEQHVVPFSFGPADFFHRRINVLIGRNGVGKSQTLAHLVTALAKPGSHKAQLEPLGEFSRVIAFSGIAGQRSLPRRSPEPRRLQYHYFDLSPSQNRRGPNQLTLALVDLFRSRDYINDDRRLDLFKKAISSFLKLEDIYIPMRADDERNPYRSHRRGDELPHNGVSYFPVSSLLRGTELHSLQRIGTIDESKGPTYRIGEALSPLSSGQELYFRFALHLCASIEAGTLVLVDEPENHLHPNFITGLMALLRDVLAQTGSFAIVASHSPFVVREVTHHDVLILERSETGAPVLRSPRLRTLGASVAAVSLNVFGDDTVPTLASLTLEGRDASIGRQDEALFDNLAKTFSNEAISHIRSKELERRRLAEGNDDA